MSAEQNINPQDYELLSAYIDGELTDDDRISLEQRLAIDSFLQHELNSLRSTVSLIHTLQPMTAPRDFTLTKAMVNTPKIIAFKPRRRMQPSYLSLVASVMLMVFGVMFMLTEFGDAQTFSAELSAPSQSQSASEKTVPPAVAIASTILPTEVDLQAERALQEPTILGATLAEELEDAPAESNDGLLNQQAPSVDESNVDDEIRQEEFDSDNANIATDGALYSVDSSSAVMETTVDSDVDGFTIAGETQALDTSPEGDIVVQDASQPMGAGGMADTGASTDTTSVGNQVPDSNDARDDVFDEAESDVSGDSNDEIGRIMSPVSDATVVPPPQSPTLARDREQSPPTPTLDNSQIGIASLIVGIFLFIVSIYFMRRNRS